MVVEGTISSAEHFRADLQRHAVRIEALRSWRRSAGRRGSTARDEIKSAEHQLEITRKVLASPSLLAQAPRIVAEGERIGGRLNELEAEAICLGILDPVRAARRWRCRRSRTWAPATTRRRTWRGCSARTSAGTSRGRRARTPFGTSDVSKAALEHGPA